MTAALVEEDTRIVVNVDDAPLEVEVAERSEADLELVDDYMSLVSHCLNRESLQKSTTAALSSQLKLRYCDIHPKLKEKVEGS